MKSLFVKRFIRWIAVILLVACIATATIFVVKALWSTIEYHAAVSLANDAPIYGSTAADLKVIEEQYTDRLPEWAEWAIMALMMVFAGISSLWLVSKKSHPSNATRKNSGESEFDDLKKIIEFNEISKLINEIEGEC